MAQRKCGTCRFFEEGGIAASGWCRHPERQDLQHMVLVRKTELACRDGWDNDLWEPRPGTDHSPSGHRASDVPSERPVGIRHSDLTGESPDTGRPEARAANQSRFDRARTEGNAYAPDRFQGSLAATQSESQARARAFESQSSTVTAQEAPVETRSDEIQDETISSRGFGDPQRWRRELAELRQDALARNQPVPPPPSAEPNDAAAETSVESNDRPNRDTGARNPARGYDLGTDASESARFGAHGFAERDARPPRGAVEQSGLTEPFDVPAEEDAEPAIEPEMESIDSVDTWGDDSTLDSDDHLSYLNGGASSAILSTFEQCCRTCRDFRPAEGRERGWCNNPHAFSERQEVNAHDVACQGSCGNWWAPSDDWWLERADISHHSAPTPLVEQLIRDKRQQDAEGSTRQGKTSYDTQKYDRRG